MSDQVLIECAGAFPKPANTDRAAEVAEDLTGKLRDAGEVDIAAHPSCVEIAASIGGNSPFLSRLALRHPDQFARMISTPVEAGFRHTIGILGEQAPLCASMDDLMALLRRAKADTALRVALADMAGVWSLEQVTAALSLLADTSLQVGLEWLLCQARAKGQVLAEGPDLAEKSGYVMLAMGKHGARELNYSSDIDLAVFYEPGALQLKEGLDPSTFFVRLTKDLVKLMQERTEEGYVFRTDLRLRPDPGGTPIAVSLPAAEQYYESRGQNWERAAYIKARPVAGDFQAAEQFLSMLRPFIWRKNLDFAAIEDIHSMKRQIHAVGGHGTIAIGGHNIKLGRGGIREIEFFVQTQQLIAGGRDPDLRGQQTCLMLTRLAAADWITDEVAGDMQAAYRFLRQLEHRLQMVDDDQTQSLPATDEGLHHIALFMGFDDQAAFEKELLVHLRKVQSHYVTLFESAPPLGEEGGSLVFTGTENDPETLGTLRDLGFDDPEGMSATIRGWHTGRFAATRSERSRERLTALKPELLRALARTADPDLAFRRFDQFLSNLPAGVQLFSMLYSNPDLLDLIAGICGTAPRLATYLSQNAAVLDAVIDSDFYAVLPERTALEAQLAEALASARDFQDVLDFSRVWARENRFRVGVRILTASADTREVGPAYAAIADVLISQLLKAAIEQVAERHGHMPGGEMIVLAMGKLGSREMSAESDLDLITVYDVADPQAMSDGKKPLMASQYYARVTQQLINALTAPTAEGKLYEVDLRLRPSGNAGPVATSLAAFEEYQKEDAWTWEHMALTRARVVNAGSELAGRVDALMAAILQSPRDVGKLKADIVDMRGKIAREFPAQSIWNLKHVRGGLIDLEFLAQFLQLAHGSSEPDIVSPDTRSIFVKAASKGLLSDGDAETLLGAFDLFHDLTQIVRICVTGDFKSDTASDSLKSRLALAGQAPDLSTLEAQMEEAQAAVHRIFEALLG